MWLTCAGETLLEEVVLMSSKVGLVKPNDHIVCVQRMGESYVIKIVSVNEEGDGVEIIRPKSLENLIRVSKAQTMIKCMLHASIACMPRRLVFMGSPCQGQSCSKSALHIHV